MAAFNVFSIVLGVATMIPFLGSMMPGRDPLVTTVRIYAGSGTDTNGHAPHVAGFDINGNLIGSVKGGDDIAQGAPYDAKIEMKADGSDGSGAQAEYISLSQAGVDAICIAGISVTWPDGLEFAWYGDVAEFCGAPWYHSTTILSSKDLYKPKCVWIDGDATNGIKTKGIGIHIPSFVATAERAESMTADKDLWCNVAPRLKFYDDLSRESALPVFKPYAEFEQGTLVDVDPAKIKDSANWHTPEWALDKKGRKDDKRSVDFEGETTVNGTNAELNSNQSRIRFHGQLNKSGSAQHSAKELCESKTSFGPDFVNVEEGYFCDMDAKRAWPLCNEVTTNNCFDNAANRMVGGKKNSRRDDVTGERIIHKRYDKVSQW
jgi:hypothetical protein